MFFRASSSRDTPSTCAAVGSTTPLPCTTSRRLRVHAEIQRTAGNNGSGIGMSDAGPVMNCAEGGPNFGFTLSPSDAGMACPDGSWKRGRYDFLTRDPACAKRRRRDRHPELDEEAGMRVTSQTGAQLLAANEP